MTEPEQPDLFDPVILDRRLSRQRTEDAVASNTAHMNAAWKAKALLAAHTLCTTRGPGFRFIADHVWLQLGGLPPGHAARSRMGPIMRMLADTGRIQKTGGFQHSLRIEQHRNLLTEWEVQW